MGIAAPVSAMLTAGLPTLLQLVGFVLALLAIGLIAGPQRTTEPPQGIGLAVLAGCGFGCFFILISRMPAATTFWSLTAARCTAIGVVLLVMRLRRRPLFPTMTGMPPVVLAGILDAICNVLFVLAAHSGRPDVAAILSSLYPAATVLLVVLVPREHVAHIQAVGILLVFLAIPVISA